MCRTLDSSYFLKGSINIGKGKSWINLKYFLTFKGSEAALHLRKAKNYNVEQELFGVMRTYQNK